MTSRRVIPLSPAAVKAAADRAEARKPGGAIMSAAPNAGAAMSDAAIKALEASLARATDPKLRERLAAAIAELKTRKAGA
jgi:hypothetical protein